MSSRRGQSPARRGYSAHSTGTSNPFCTRIAKHNCVVQVLYNTDEQLRSAAREFVGKFSSEINAYNILLVENESDVKTLPF